MTLVLTTLTQFRKKNCQIKYTLLVSIGTIGTL